ncbi:MAG: hypothetical protein NC828_02555 [Candidatus Omnitrophica bacterium]|nr:hypothetical protein [Candidatus Omnitrophota bacterium]
MLPKKVIIMWWIIGGVLLIGFLIWLYKSCVVYLPCPKCGIKIDIAKGLLEYDEPFDCPVCKGRLTRQDFVKRGLIKNGKKDINN